MKKKKFAFPTLVKLHFQSKASRVLCFPSELSTAHHEV